jgi:hypothetical protein
MRIKEEKQKLRENLETNGRKKHSKISLVEII